MNRITIDLYTRAFILSSGHQTGSDTWKSTMVKWINLLIGGCHE